MNELVSYLVPKYHIFISAHMSTTPGEPKLKVKRITLNIVNEAHNFSSRVGASYRPCNCIITYADVIFLILYMIIKKIKKQGFPLFSPFLLPGKNV